MQSLKVDITKIMTQSAYAKKKCISRQLVNNMIKNKKLTTIEIPGATLILLD